MDDMEDWQPPKSWTEAADFRDLRMGWEQKFAVELAMRHGSTAPTVRRMIDRDLDEYGQWRADPEGYRAERIAQRRATYADALKPRSHAMARRMLELPDSPVMHEDDGIERLLRSVCMKTTEVSVAGLYIEVIGVSLNEWEDDDPP